ncbi:MAG: asparagine synthase (glutamine-hydrolyzing) [Candidatus Omnitrophica bacterium]|nr:asparagine synthase (glutamine-hydrolyzing) [Candidatus Omnitrophota bacterium]
MDEIEKNLSRMLQSLGHRGPDAQGKKIINLQGCRKNVGLGHARLAVLDLSEAANQPMVSQDGNVWISFNGEIYNFKELKRNLQRKGYRFRSNSDTEVIVNLYQEVGKDIFQLLDGIFGLAILDLKNQELILARDPLGVKPLYYCRLADRFIFASEIKGILAEGRYRSEVNWQAAYDYFTYLYVPSPETFFKNIFQLPPAHTLTLNLKNDEMSLKKYWQIRRLENIEKASYEELKGLCRQSLRKSVKEQLQSDVPIGVFLSGGTDSTIITGLAKEDQDIKTFTAVFQGKEYETYNERARAQTTSDFLRTEHYELEIESPDPMEMLQLIDYFDQPFGNPTFYLMFLISKKARQHITVALSGAGGDELYAGYPRYRVMSNAGLLGKIPSEVFKLSLAACSIFRDRYTNMTLRRIRKFLDGAQEKNEPDRFLKWVYFLDDRKKKSLFLDRSITELYGDMLPSSRIISYFLERSFLADRRNKWLQLDVQTFLVENILEYTDKMSMAHGLEVRVPLLNPAFVELSLNIPYALKAKGGDSKILLKDAFSDFFSPTTENIPKRGFNVPLGQWMTNCLDQYFDMNDSTNMNGTPGETWKKNILNVEFIKTLRNQHKRGYRDNSYELFAIMMFDVWWRKYMV